MPVRCAEYVDLVIPRGGRGLVELVCDDMKFMAMDKPATNPKEHSE